MENIRNSNLRISFGLNLIYKGDPKIKNEIDQVTLKHAAILISCKTLTTVYYACRMLLFCIYSKTFNNHNFFINSNSKITSIKFFTNINSHLCTAYKLIRVREIICSSSFFESWSWNILENETLKIFAGEGHISSSHFYLLLVMSLKIKISTLNWFP